MLFREWAACYFALVWETNMFRALLSVLFECRAVMEQSNPSAQRYWFMNQGFCSALILKHMSALATGEITRALKMLEVGDSLEHWGVWITDVLPGDESPRSLQLPVQSESSFLKIREVEMGKEVFPNGPCSNGLCKPRKTCWCAQVCQNQDVWRTLHMMYPTDSLKSEESVSFCFLSLWLCITLWW